MDQLKSLCAAQKLRLTTPRKIIFQTLQNAHHPLALHELSRLCPDINRSSIYRTLELFGRIGIVEQITVGWKTRYELAGPFAPHHHHLVCTQCHSLEAIHPPELESLIASVTKKAGFLPTNHHFEISGTCKLCQQATTKREVSEVQPR